MSPFPIVPITACACVATLLLLLTIWALEDDTNPFRSVRLVVGCAVLMAILSAFVVVPIVDGHPAPVWQVLAAYIVGLKVIRRCSWRQSCWLVTCNISLAISLAAFLAVAVGLFLLVVPQTIERIDQTITIVRLWGEQFARP